VHCGSAVLVNAGWPCSAAVAARWLGLWRPGWDLLGLVLGPLVLLQPQLGLDLVSHLVRAARCMHRSGRRGRRPSRGDRPPGLEVTGFLPAAQAVHGGLQGQLQTGTTLPVERLVAAQQLPVGERPGSDRQRWRSKSIARSMNRTRVATRSPWPSGA
jgi:hypothetical protein